MRKTLKILSFLALCAIVGAFIGGALADDRLKPNTRAAEYSEISGSSVTSSDLYMLFDDSTQDWVKSDPTDVNIDSGTIDNVALGGTTPAAGAFTTVDASGTVTLDDGVTASPSLSFIDATNETAVFSKADAGYLSVTTDATDGLSVLVGNLSVGNGTPGLTLGGEDGYIEGTFEVDGTVQLDGTLDVNGAITGDGGAALSGMLRSQVASTTTTATIAQCGVTFVSDSTDVITLPEASTALGCRYTFVCGTADDFDINPNDGTDAISILGSITGANTTTVLAPSAGDAIRCTDIGASLSMEAIGADLWAVIGGTTGIWTDVN